MEKLLPQNIEAEQALLGSILIDPEVIDEISDLITADDFYRDVHRTIYAVMVRLHARREPIDLITLANELERDQQLEEVGDFSYLTSLSCQVPTSVNAEHYARIVAKKAELRRIIHAGGQIAAMAYEEAEDALAHSEQILAAIGQRGQGAEFSTMASMMMDCMSDFDDLKKHHGSITGVPTGYHALDSLLGGLQPSDLVILAARPSVGKTTLAQNIAYNAMIDEDMRIAFFSLEMSKKQLSHRFIAMDSRVDAHRLRTNTIYHEEWERISKSMGILSDGRLWVDDTSGLDIDVMRGRIRRLHNKHQIDLVIVDYLQQMHATVNGKRPYVREQEVAEIARKLKQVAKDLNVPVLALAQLNRDGGKELPDLHHLRESGQIEQEADVVMFIHQDTEAPNTLDVLIRKHRNGPRGEVRLGFEAMYTRFFNIGEDGSEIQ